MTQALQVFGEESPKQRNEQTPRVRSRNRPGGFEAHQGAQYGINKESSKKTGLDPVGPWLDMVKNLALILREMGSHWRVLTQA